MRRILSYLLATFAAIGVTILLWWLIATVFSIGDVDLDDVPDTTASLRDTQGDPQLECLARTTGLRQVIAESNQCEVDEDCALLNTGGKSPGQFTCLVGVRADRLPTVQDAFGRHQSCDVVADCETAEGRPVCEDNLCQVAAPVLESQ